MSEYHLYAFLICHLIGDFFLQSSELSDLKKNSYKAVIKHSILYAIPFLTLNLIVNNTILISLILIISHWFVDTAKFFLTHRKNITASKEVIIFIIDQIVHILLIILFMVFLNNNLQTSRMFNWVYCLLSTLEINTERVILWLFALLIIEKPSNVLIQLVLSAYRPNNETNNAKFEKDIRIGRTIGSLERLIMLTLMSLNQYSSVALVITAKSVARYDRIAKDKEFAETYLLGTLLSTAIVIITKMLIII